MTPHFPSSDQPPRPNKAGICEGGTGQSASLPKSAEMEMTKYPYRHITPHPPDLCSRLLLTACKNQHRHGVEIQPVWRHCPRMVVGRVKGTKVIFHSSRLGIDSRTAILYADILGHGNGSVIVGEFRIGSRIFFWIFRAFVSVLFGGAVGILLLGKLHDPQALSGYGLSIAVLMIFGVYFGVMWGINKTLTISLEDVLFVHRFIEEATTENHSKS